MKPIIGVMPLIDDEKESIWMLPGYMEGIRSAGGLPIILPLTDDPEEIRQLADICDGLLFTGGHDVTPALYHEEPPVIPLDTCIARDRMELWFMKFALEKDIPVLGICRGIQFINAALGGTLYQDLPLLHPSETEHHQKPPYDRPAHSVRIIEGTPLHELLGKTDLSVNSYHHQAVKDLAPSLTAMAISEDGLTEAVFKPDRKYVWAVQWHPEFAYRTDEDALKIFKAFVNAAADK